MTPNRSTSFKSPAHDPMSTKAPDVFDEDIINWDEGPSSPFVTEVADQENSIPRFDLLAGSSPSKQRSPSKSSRLASPPRDVETVELNVTSEIVHDESDMGSLPHEAQEMETPNNGPAAESLPDTLPANSLTAPELAVSTPTKQPTSISSPANRPASYPQDLRDNEGLTIAIQHMVQGSRTSPKKQSTAAIPSLDGSEDLTATMRVVEQQGSINLSANDEMDYDHETTTLTVDDTNIDDTCFSTFSAVPDMTVFAKLGARSPTKSFVPNLGSIRTPRGTTRSTPNTARRNGFTFDRSPSPTPRGTKTQTRTENDTTNLLLDFTQQFETLSSHHRGQRSPTRPSPTKSTTTPDLLSYIHNQRSPHKSSAPQSTPIKNRNLLNLLDFELPPAPTPRSLPSITVRELESLKSGYLSQISSLTASLSGREAEVGSLKKAVSDAERRVGEAQETVREERSAREHAEKEKKEWEARGREVEGVLRAVKEEVISAEKEREELGRKVEAAERRAEESEMRAQEAERRAVEAESRVVDQTVAGPEASGEGKEPKSPRFTAEQVQKQIDEKVASLCKELHVVYKKKHETKVAALKKSYESKADKKTMELVQRISELTRQNEELVAAKESTFSSVLPTELGAALSREREADAKIMEEQRAEIDEQRAKLAGLASEIESVRRSHDHLLQELEKERIEKGELVAAVDEMLALQADFGAPVAGADVVEDFRKSISKPSGLRGPGFAGESRLGRPGAPSGLSRGVSKSKIMSNIERMGSGRTVQ